MNDKTPRLSLSTILGAGIILCLVVGIVTFMRLNQADDHTTSTLTQKADALFTAIEAGARSGGRIMPDTAAGRRSGLFERESTRFEEGLKGILGELGDQPDIRFVAVTDPEGRILAHSNPRHVGSALFSPLDMEELGSSPAVQWRMIDFPSGQAFLVYREFTPLREPLPPLPQPSVMRRRMMRGQFQPPAHQRTEHPDYAEHGEHAESRESPEQELSDPSATHLNGKNRRFHHGAGGLGLAPVIFVAYDPTPYIKAQTDRERQSLLETAVSTLLGLVALVLLFWRENLSQTRRLLGDARAFANEVVGSFPDGLVILDTKGKPIHINSTARRFLGIPAQSSRKELKPGQFGTSQASGEPESRSADLASDQANDQDRDLTSDLISKKDFLSPNDCPALPPALKDAMKRLERNNFVGSQELPCLDNLLAPLKETMPDANPSDISIASGMPGVPGEDTRNSRGTVCCFELRGARVRSVQKANPPHDSEKEHIADLLIIRDLTELKNLQRNLRQSEKLAAIGSLAAGVAHEIRNPLSSIKGYASIFARLFAKNSPEQEAALALAREAERLNRAVSDLLSLSGASNLRLVSTRLKELLEHSMLLVNADAQKQGVNVELRLAEIPPCELDPDKISQAALNLLLNALEAMPGGGVLKVSLTSWAASQPAGQEATPQQWARISIADSGKGIAPADLPRIFDAYFSTKAGGTGLGLATTQKIIQAHGGRIEAQSGPNGAVFVINLPINRQSEHSGNS